MPVAVALLALVFTVASFWWIWLRRGKLVATAPRYYASVSTTHTLRIRFPIVVRNTGARPLVVEDLRMLVAGETLDWTTTRSTVKPQDKSVGDVVDVASPFAVAGRETLPVIAEFGTDGPSWRPDPATPYLVVIEAVVRGSWKVLAEFTWWTPATDLGAYIAHRNREDTSSA